jgi:hypothetical protein
MDHILGFGVRPDPEYLVFRPFGLVLPENERAREAPF